jgi:hypothetical protein
VLASLIEVTGTTVEERKASSSYAQNAGPPTDNREVIYFDEAADDIDYITLHNILYFLYIGCVNLPFSKDEAKEQHPEGYPGIPDPFRLFRNAHKFHIPLLTDRCLFYLDQGITPKSAVERLFHPECENYDALKTLYFDYLVANYDQVKETKEWERALCNDDDVSPAVARFRARLLFDISKRLSTLQK